MHVGFKLAIGAGLVGAGALALAACGNPPARTRPYDDSDVLRAADNATWRDSSMRLAYDIVANSGRPAAESVLLLRESDRMTGRDSSMLEALRAGVESSRSAEEFAIIARAADRATGRDASALQLLELGLGSTLPADRIARIFDEADRATGRDNNAISLAESIIHRAENEYPSPDEVQDPGSYPSGGTSSGDS